MIIMIIVTMLTDHDNDNSHHADEHGDEHVWCLERTARPLPATPGRTPGPSDSQTTHQNPMCCIVLLLPPYQTKWTHLFLLPAEAYSPPDQPRPNLNAVPHICTKMTLGCAFKAATKVAPSFASRRLPLPPAAYISLHCTVTPTAPPDCSQTRLKTDQQTTPQTDSVYLSEQPHQNCETS